MSLRYSRSLEVSRMLVLGVLSLVGCPGGGGGGSIPSDGTTSAASTLDGAPGGAVTDGEPGLDSTGSPIDPCVDDYEGNHSLPSAFALGLESTDMVRGTFGDGVILGAGNQQGQDHLVVCPGLPDFFSLEVACAGFVGIVVRRAGDGDVELHLYDADGLELDGAVEAWNGFIIQPIHRFVEAGEHIIEARHGGGGAQEYGLDVYVLPMQPCT